jgi:hypothetical protein
MLCAVWIRAMQRMNDYRRAWQDSFEHFYAGNIRQLLIYSRKITTLPPEIY